MAFLDKTKRNFARGKQLALEKMDRTSHTTDAEFKEWKNHYEKLYKQLEQARLLFEDSYQSLKDFSIAQSEVSIHFQRMFDSTTPMYGSVTRNLECTKLVDAERLRFEDEMNNNVISPIAKHLAQFKEIKDRISIRDTRRLDMDRYARDVSVHTSNNHPEKAQKAQEKLDSTSNAYYTLHAELVDDMKDLHHDRSLFLTPLLATYIVSLAQYFRGTSHQVQQMTPFYQNIDRSAIHEHIWVISQVSATSPSDQRPAVPPKNGAPSAANTTQAYQQYAHHDPTASILPPYNPHMNAPQQQGYPNPQQGYQQQGYGVPPQNAPNNYNQPPPVTPYQNQPPLPNRNPGFQQHPPHQNQPALPSRPQQQGQQLPPPPRGPPFGNASQAPGLPPQPAPPPSRQFPPQQQYGQPPPHPDGRPRGPSFGNASQAPGQPPHNGAHPGAHQLPPPPSDGRPRGPSFGNAGQAPGQVHQQHGQQLPLPPSDGRPRGPSFGNAAQAPGLPPQPTPPSRQFPPQHQGQNLPPNPEGRPRGPSFGNAAQAPGQPAPPSRQFPQHQGQAPPHPDGRPRGPSFGNAGQAPGQVPQQHGQQLPLPPSDGRPRGPSFGNASQAPGQAPPSHPDGRPRGPSFGSGTAPGAARPPMMAHGQLPVPSGPPQQRVSQNPFEDNPKTNFQNDLAQALNRPKGPGAPPQQKKR
eukprot:TRINITY_DN5961_c0_g1_i2.p1 TRINITY_DN5961_c0_g1~~TRINITY_DN5961_c0_g1_i2.p1  ORF type:complete len:690 (-),score=197.29 TRINITY_DN5961_c0_g1_i2:33-2102(-)